MDFAQFIEAAFLNLSNISIDELMRVRTDELMRASQLFNTGTALRAIVIFVGLSAVDTAVSD